MPFAGLDVHKRVIQAVVLNDDGQVVHRERFACDRELLVRYAQKHLGPTARVALEATTNTWSIVDILKPLVGEVVVSNPMRTRAIAEAKVKTDKVDALILAQLLRADFLPRVWQPDVGTQARRRLTSRRAALVSDRTRIKNRIHAVLHQRLIEPPVTDLFGTKGMAWLRALDLDAAGRAAIDSELRMLTQLEKEIAAIHETLAVDGYDDPRVRLLMTLPGVDVAVAQTLLAALGDIHRFRDGDHAASYLGLVPSTRQSADKCYHGPITKQGSRHARWMLIQAAQHISTQPGPLGVFFRRLVTHKNHNVAVVATARKLVVIAWHMLKNNEPYRYAVPRTTERKLAGHRVKATGERRVRATPKSKTPLKADRTGNATRVIPSLDALYEREGVPPLKPLSKGETRMLSDQGLLPFVEETRRTRRVPRRGTSVESTSQQPVTEGPRERQAKPAGRPCRIVGRASPTAQPPLPTRTARPSPSQKVRR